MSEQRPTREQWLAVNVLDRDIAVTAGAGSGKTWVLTRRYVTQLAGKPIVPEPIVDVNEPSLPTIVYPEPVTPEQIIAITFTEKAASEMRERIRGELERLYLASDSDQEREQWLAYMDEVEHAVITTIHGLCARLIRQFPLHAQVNPHFIVLEPHEADALFEEAMDTAITKGLQSDNSKLLQVLREYPMFTLRQSLRRLFDQLRESIDPIAWDHVNTYTRQVLKQQQIVAVTHAEELVRVGDYVQQSQPESSKGVFEKQMETLFHAHWPTWRKQITDCNGLWNGELRESVKKMMESCKGRVPKSYQDSVPEFVDRLKIWSRSMCSEPYNALVEAVVHVLRDIEYWYSILKRKRHALDFTDMQIAAIRLLQDPHIRRKATHSIRYVMVDEFQDTNQMQARLVRSLAERARLFIVGDAKQSIYGFRQADVGVFIQLQDEILRKRDGQKIELQHNFRTVSPIISFVNRFFNALMAPSETSLESASYRVAYDAGMIATRATPDELPRIEWIHIPLDTEEDPTQSSESEGIGQDAAGSADSNQVATQPKLVEAEVIAKRIRSLCEHEEWIVEKDQATGEIVNRRVRYGDITLLFSAMTHVRFYEFMLQTYNIPYYVVGGRNFYQKQEIIDVLHVLRILLNSSDELSLVGALRSPMFAVSDEGLYWIAKNRGLSCVLSPIDASVWDHLSNQDRKHIARFQELLGSLRQYAVFATVGEVVERIYEDTGILEIVLSQFGGKQKLGNLQKLLQIAYRYQIEKQYSTIDFVRFLEQMIEQEIDETEADVTALDADVVKIMTIHQSKGLEFPVVILPDLARKPRPDSVTFHYHAESGLQVKLKISEQSTGSGEKTIPLDGSGSMLAISQEVADRAKQEERRKLYVAMTRARDYLILVGSKQSTTVDPIKALAGANWFDWVASIIMDGQEDTIVSASESFGVRYLTPEALEDARHESTSQQITVQESTVHEPKDVSESHQLDDIQKSGFESDIPLILELDESEVSRMNSRLPSYRTATMVVDERDDRIRFKRQYELGLPDWPEWGWNTKQKGANEVPQSLQEIRSEGGRSSLEADQLGTIVHRVCELLKTKDHAVEITQQVLLEFGFSDATDSEEFSLVWQLVQRYIESDVFRDITYAASVQSEVPFRVILDGQEYTGIIDKMITDHDGHITVIDFKTNVVTPYNREELKQKYQVQLDLYQRALSAILGRTVDTKLVFLRDL